MIDTHAHLYLCKEDNRVLLQAAYQAGVRRIIQIAVDSESSKEIVKDAGHIQGLYATVGIHPCYVQEDQNVSAIRELLETQLDNICAIGEIGLDYKYGLEHKDLQHQIFRALADLARDYHLPIVVHQRQAEEDMVGLLSEYADVKTVLHCFSSHWDFASRVMRPNLYFSFTGMVTFAKKGKVVEVIRQLPMNRIMIETDCPYLTPKAYSGNENQPAFVGEVAKKLAEIKKVSYDEVTSITQSNAETFFNIRGDEGCLGP